MDNLPDLIILDLFMPILDGWEFLARREKDQSLRSIPVIVVSASTTHMVQSVGGYLASGIASSNSLVRAAIISNIVRSLWM